MQKVPIIRYILLLLITGLVGLAVFAAFLIHGQISDSLSTVKRELRNKADKAAARLEIRLHQTYERVDIIALNPIIQKGDPKAVKNLLEKTMNHCSPCEALLVLEHDGSLIAEAPMDSHYSYLKDNNLLNPLLEESELLYIHKADEIEHYDFVCTTKVQTSEENTRTVIAFLELSSIVESTLMGGCGDKVTLITEDNHEIALIPQDHKTELRFSSGIFDILSPFVRKKSADYLQSTAPILRSEWQINISRPFELFWSNNVKSVLRGFRFYTLLLCPILIIFILIILAINHSRHYFKELSLKDGLTGLYNHRAFQTELRSIIGNEGNRKVSLLMIDLDDFKSFNDTYGHQAGDELLKKVASILLKNIRNQDIPTRYGGEEFAVILPGIGIEEASKVADRIRKAIKTRCTITVSIGVSSLPEYASTAEKLIQSADEALYKAKRMSKDRVEAVNTQKCLS